MRELAAGDRKKRWGTYALAFFLPLAVIAAIFWMLHIYPFGEKTLVVWDANPQYVDFLVYLKKMLSGEVSLSYTFSISHIIAGKQSSHQGQHIKPDPSRLHKTLNSPGQKRQQNHCVQPHNIISIGKDISRERIRRGKKYGGPAARLILAVPVILATSAAGHHFQHIDQLESIRHPAFFKKKHQKVKGTEQIIPGKTGQIPAQCLGKSIA